MKSEVEPVYGGIDAGGTAFKCMVVSSAQNIIAEREIATGQPSDTLAECIRFFRDSLSSVHALQSLGIASFGPLNVDSKSPDYGLILPGPKSGWAGTNLKTIFEQALKVPVAIDTDVNGALLAEQAWGNAKGCHAAAYVTIGTGIGAGLMSGGMVLGRPAHPEFGHIRVERHNLDRHFDGVCGIHGDCLEGLASGPSLWARYGDPNDLPEDHILWEIVASYLAQACIVLSLSIRPEVIMLGGGVMRSHHMLDKIQDQYLQLMNNYLGQSKADVERMIIPPGLGDKAGGWGGIWLAQNLIKPSGIK